MPSKNTTNRGSAKVIPVSEAQPAVENFHNISSESTPTSRGSLIYDEGGSHDDDTFTDFLSKLEDKDKDPEAIIASSNLSRSFMETMRLNSEIHSNLSSFRSGGAAPLRTDPTKTAKSMKTKSKSYSSPTTKLPLLGGVIPAHKIFNRLNSGGSRKPDPNALQDKDANGEKVQLTKTPVELLRYITEGDVEIEKIDQITTPRKLILKYKQGQGSIEFKGRFVLPLDENGQDRKQEYDPDYGEKLDPLKQLDQDNRTKIDQIIQTNTTLQNKDLQLVTEFFTKHTDKEMPIFYTTEPYEDNQTILKLEVLASNGKAITTDVDIATRSIPLNLPLPKHLDKHLYEPINMSESGMVKKIQNKRKLLNYTMELFEHFKQNYYEKMRALEEEIKITQITIAANVAPTKSTVLQEQLKTLEVQQKMLLESPIGRFMEQELTQAQEVPINNWADFSKIRQILSRRQQPKLNFSDLFLGGETAKKHFTELAGIVTPFEFLQNILDNCIAKTDALQHGADIRTPADPENAEQIMFFKGKIFRTQNDQQRMTLYLNEEFFKEQFIPVNPKANMEVWGELVEKQLASPQHKARVSKGTKLAYFNHLMTNRTPENLLSFITKLPTYALLDSEQKKEFLAYVQQHTEQNDDRASIHKAIQTAKRNLPLTGFSSKIGTIFTNFQETFTTNTASSNQANIDGTTTLQSPTLSKREETYSPNNSPRPDKRRRPLS